MAIRKSSNSGIPFGNNANRPANPAVGQPYFNGQENRLEIYTQSVGWQNIVAETPGVVSYTGTVLETNSTNTLVISGTNFTTGAIASLIGNDGTEYIANTTTVNSIVQITAVFPAISASKEPYDIKVVNPSNLYGILPDVVSVNDKPVWTTAAGSLGTFNEFASISISLSSNDEESNSITYSLAPGSSLPTGVTLNSSTGVISGTLPSIDANTTYTFTINASDGYNEAVSRTFSITSKNLPDGGTTSVSGQYRIHSFTGSGTFVVPESIVAEYLIVAGGGAGGDDIGGGGGGGGVLSGTTTLSAQSYNIIVGAGGAASVGFEGSGNGNDGNNSSALGLTAYKGQAGGGEGNGAQLTQNGPYGSGGGGGYNAQSGGAGTAGQGNSGGSSYGGIAAGGGGAGGAGQSTSAGSAGGNGGPGIANSILGVEYYWAGGGGGNSYGGAQQSGNGGIGGGGGASTFGNTNNVGAGSGGGSALNSGNAGSHTNGKGGDGGANTGGGGGGSKESNGNQFSISGAGGSGIVVIRYQI